MSLDLRKNFFFWVFVVIFVFGGSYCEFLALKCSHDWYDLYGYHLYQSLSIMFFGVPTAATFYAFMWDIGVLAGLIMSCGGALSFLYFLHTAHFG